MRAQIVPSLRESPRRELDLERMAAWLRPLASPVRLKLLRYLTTPHYLEEVASHLHVSRQAARKHLEKLVSIGVLERKSGVRETGPVTEYVINPQALFLIYDEFEKLGTLRRDERPELMARTLTEGDAHPGSSTADGPCLWIVRGLSTGTRIALPRGTKHELVLGRDYDCEVVLHHDPYASNRHAAVSWDGRRFVLSDLRSTNGTRHNWASLPRGGSVPLKQGDVVGVGRTLLLFWDGP